MIGIKTATYCFSWLNNSRTISNNVQGSHTFSLTGLPYTLYTNQSFEGITHAQNPIISLCQLPIYIHVVYINHSYSLNILAMDLNFVFRDLSGNEIKSLPKGSFIGLSKLSKA